jgi:hypothetical protein
LWNKQGPLSRGYVAKRTLAILQLIQRPLKQLLQHLPPPPPPPMTTTMMMMTMTTAFPRRIQ